MTALLSSSALARLRKAADRHLLDTCTIERPNDAPSDALGDLEGDPTSTDVACRWEPMSTGANGQPDETAGWRVFLPWTIDIETTDRLVYGGTTYHVTFADEQFVGQPYRMVNAFRLGAMG